MLLGYPWWLLLLAAAGVVGLIALTLSLFSGLGDRPASAKMTTGCSVDSDEFLDALAGVLNAPRRKGGSARLLNNGHEYFPVILDALRGAERTINLMMYMWEPGEISERFMETLTERARAGVGVRVMVDSLGGHKVPDEQVEAFRRAGGRWAWFHPPHFGKLTRLHKRNHRRVIVVDGRVGFTGGAAVVDKWLGDARSPEEWRDSMVEVRGGLASNLQSAFSQLWTHVTGEMLVGTEFYAADPDRDPTADDAGELISQHINVVSSPSSEAHPMRFLFWLSFRAACERIYITNPYFVPDDIMCEVLMERARAGLDVRVLVPGEHIDIPLIRWASRHNYERLLEAGLRIYEYQPTMIHQKLAVIDGKWSIVGSANLDVRSKELNQENALGILDTGFARQVEEAFWRDLESAQEIRLDEFRQRSLVSRVGERLAALFEEQF